MTPAEFNRTVDDMVTNLLRVTVQEAKPGVVPDKVMEIIKSARAKHQHVFDNFDSMAKAQYANAVTDYNRIVDERLQHDWATTVDHGKVFIWRTSQALAFAAIVLVTAYVAQELGITFTLTRLIPPP